MFIGSTKKLWGAFKFKSAADRRDQIWSKFEPKESLIEIHKLANKWLEEKGTHSVEIKVYDNSAKKWKLVSTKKA